MFDVTEPGALERDHPPTHPGEAGVKAKNANRQGGHGTFVPVPFPCFNAEEPLCHTKIGRTLFDFVALLQVMAGTKQLDIAGN